MTLEQVETLHKSYADSYSKAKLEYKEKTGRITEGNSEKDRYSYLHCFNTWKKSSPYN